MSVTHSLQRSRKLLKEMGYETWIVEKPFNPFTKRREDLFHCIDLIGIRGDMEGVTGIQACGDDVADHIRKIKEGYVDGKGRPIPPNPYVYVWLKAQNRFFIWSWRLRKHKGTKDTWQLREIEFVLKDGQVIAREVPHEETEKAKD